MIANKIALLTFWNENNYGAKLQAYATIKALKILGWNPILINIQISPKKVPTILGRIANMIEHISPAENKFRHFGTKYIRLTKPYKSVEDLYNNPPLADVYMVGSDQVWNPDITKELWPIYFLKFVPTEAKRVSFSSSFGVEDWCHQECTEVIKKELNKFSYITCREESGIGILKNAFGVFGKWVLDPTLLFDSYSELAHKIQPTKTLVYYPLSDDPELEDYCKSIAPNLGLTPVNANHKNYLLKKILWDRTSIEQWVQSIASAEFVITRSFHGLAFCLIYKKQFAILNSRNGRGTRVENLLEKLQLNKRLFKDTKQIDLAEPWKTPIDYSIVTPLLEKYRGDSWNILKKMLEE